MKIPKVDTTRQYELTLLVAPSYTDSELTKLKEEVSELVTKNKGEVVSQEDWGKRPLAYKLKRAGRRYEEAVYLHFVIEMQAEKAASLERAVRLHNQVLRHLLVIANLAEESSQAKLEETK